MKLSLPKMLLFLCLFGNIVVKAQNNKLLHLKSGNYTLESTFDKGSNTELVNNKYYRIIQFQHIPSTAQKEALKNEGVTLLNYVPNNAFYAQINIPVDLSFLKSYDVNAVVKIENNYKLSKKLYHNKLEEWALNGSKVKLNAMFFEGVSESDVSNVFNNLGAEIIRFNGNNVARIEIEISQLSNLYAQPIFYYFEQIDPPSMPENLVGVSDHRSNNLATSYASGLKYDGTGITVMLQDNSKLDEHIDYTGRFTDINATQSGDHGEHCGGTIAYCLFYGLFYLVL